jgi:alginate O-acetyltransferase complex protein AlgI
LSEGGKPVVFSSLTFLFLLPAAIMLRALFSRAAAVAESHAAARQPAFSTAWGEPVYICIMFLSILIDYTHGHAGGKVPRPDDRLARWFVTESVIFNLLLLGFFKYWDFFAANLSLLPGVSTCRSWV